MKIEVSVPVVFCKEEKRKRISAYVSVQFRRKAYNGIIIEDEDGWGHTINWSENILPSEKNKTIFKLFEQTLRSKEVIIDKKVNRRFYVGQE